MENRLRPHQADALEEMSDGRILKGGVGTGKSRVAMAYFVERVCGGWHEPGAMVPFTEPRDLVVITTAKKRDDRDWEAEAAPYGISTDREASFGGVTITVDSWQNLAKYTEVKDAFFIFDEQRLVGAGAWVKAFYAIAEKNRWILLSATPGDTWMDWIPVFIANGYYPNRTEFIRQHVVYKRFVKFPVVDYFINTHRLQQLRAKIIVDMPYDRHTIRHVLQTIVPHDEEMFKRVWKDRWHVYEDRPLKDVGEMFMVGRKVVNSDVARVGEVMRILEKHPRLIIFYNFNYELDMLRVMASSIEYPVAEWNGHKHEAVPDTSKWVYLVQYTAGAEGWNCTATDAMVFFSLNYSWKINEQAKGRIDRLNTSYTDLWYYILRSSSDIDRLITKALAQKKSFNEPKLWTVA